MKEICFKKKGKKQTQKEKTNETLQQIRKLLLTLSDAGFNHIEAIVKKKLKTLNNKI